MATSFKFYSDSGLTTLLTSLTFTQGDNGSSPPADRVAYFGSPTTGVTAKAQSNPGVDPITVSITDSATGGGVQAAHIKLAATSGGLAGATAGAALSLGAQVLGGVANAVPVWVRVDTPALTAGVYSDAGLTTPSLVEV